MLDTILFRENNPDVLAGGNVPVVPAKDQSAAERQRRCRAKKRRHRDSVTDGVTDRDSRPDEITLLPDQAKVAITFTSDGDLVLKQANWPDEDQMIVIRRDNIGTFIDALTDSIGIPSVGGP